MDIMMKESNCVVKKKNNYLKIPKGAGHEVATKNIYINI